MKIDINEKLYIKVLKSGKQVKYSKLSKNVNSLLEKDLACLTQAGMLVLTEKGCRVEV